MRRFYSLLLTAAFLLVGMNVWAAGTHTPKQEGDQVSLTIGEATTYAATFADAWNAVSAGQTATIKLLTDVEVTTTFWLGTIDMGTSSVDANVKNITIDLAGFDFTSSAARAFLVTRGALKVITSNAREGHNKVEHTGASETFYVTGSTLKDVDPSVDGADYFSYLLIGANVTVIRPELTGTGTAKWSNYKCAAIAIDGIANVNTALVGTEANRPHYLTNVYAPEGGGANKCVANGVRIDIRGTVNGLRYGIKPNGYLGNVAYFINKENSGAALPAAGVQPKYNNALLDQSYRIKSDDDMYSPFIHIYPEGKVTALSEIPEVLKNNHESGYPAAGKKSGTQVWGTPSALYGGGAARWLVEGTAQGASGAIIKSGSITLQDAHIEGLGSYLETTHTTSSNTGQGSGLLVVSDNSWAGDVKVTVNGGTEVKSDDGYAIEEVVPAVSGSGDGTKVSNITLNGGTFEGGDEGAIIVSQKTAEDPGSVVLVNAATITGNVNYGENGELDDIIPSNKEDILIKEDEYGVKTVVVVLQTTPDPIVDTDIHPFDIDTVTDSKNYDLSNLADGNRAQIFDADARMTMTIGSLRINPNPESTDVEQEVSLTIAAGHTLIADRIVLGEKGKIIVKPGATLIVKGTEGLVSSKVENLILESTASQKAIFIFNPGVLSNNHPKATVELTSYSFHKDDTDYQWERFGIPTWTTVESIESSINNLYTDIQVFENGEWQDLGYHIGGHGEDFANIDRLNKPFAAYNLLAYKLSAGAKYTFTGALVGNLNATLNTDREWNPFSNSYSAKMDVEALIEGLANATNIDAVVYIPTLNGPGKYTWDPVDAEWASGEKLAPMQAFILHNRAQELEARVMSYASVVYNPAIAAYSAPRRNAAINDNSAKLRVVVANQEGLSDNVKLSENTNTKAYAKYMNDDVNIYVMDDNKYSIMASEDLADTYLGFSTVEGGNFTISFANVQGREFDLIDLNNNARVAVVEGETYTFAAAANTVADYRFQLVERAKLPTAIENTEVKANVKGIYTITGQYLGEMNVWNTLPAGIYVVNGAKRVK